MRADVETAVAQVARKVGYRSADRYRSRCKFLFKGLEFQGARVLDVGCGKGALALWAGLHGASHVLGIEPEGDGSTQGTLAAFREATTELDLDGVVDARASFLEKLTFADGPFDIVVLFNVINHLDEEAVVELHASEDAVARYMTALRHLRSLMVAGGVLIVADCGRRNFWNDFGLRNPLMPTIEWHKHQQPGVWESLFRQAGFSRLDLRWSPMYPLGVVSDNWPLHYFTISHFTLRLRAV